VRGAAIGEGEACQDTLTVRTHPVASSPFHLGDRRFLRPPRGEGSFLTRRRSPVGGVRVLEPGSAIVSYMPGGLGTSL